MFKILNSIKSRFSFFIIVFVLIPFILFGLVWYEKASVTIEKNAIDYNRQIISQLNGQLDRYFNDIEKITFPMLLHPQIQTFMQLAADDQYNRNVINQTLTDEMFPNITFGRPDILGISIISNNGLAISNYSFIEGLRSYEQYKNILLDERNYRIIGIDTIDSTPVITIIRKFLDTVSYEASGILVVHLRLNEIISMAEQIQLGESGVIWLLDDAKKVIYHSDRELWGTDTSSLELFSHLDEETAGYYLQEGSQDDKLIIYEKSNISNWTLVSEVSMNDLTKDLIRLRTMTIMFLCFLGALAFIVMGGFSFYLTNSLLIMQRLMRRAENGELHVKAPDSGQNEIGALYRSFNSMVSQIQRLLEEVESSKLKEQEMEIRQRESQLQVMHSQINPHFLYNTLEIINSYAIVEGIQPISNMTTSLAEIFRYSVANPNQIVTLNDEIQYIQTYLNIQKERFSKLEVQLDIDQQDAQYVQALRLIIQPIVENSFKHGYQAHRLKPNFIGIYGSRKEHYYEVQIEDRGNGMPLDVKARYNAAFNGDLTHSFASIGLWNVHHRIQLSFGSSFGLWIEKSDKSGTIISIRLNETRRDDET